MAIKHILLILMIAGYSGGLFMVVLGLILGEYYPLVFDGVCAVVIATAILWKLIKKGNNSALFIDTK